MSRQQVIELEDSFDNKHANLIHNNGSQFTTIDYVDYGITGVRTGIRSPNMNAYAERIVRSIRKEALDHFILISKKQIKKIVKESVNYYNEYRPHQGLGDIPEKSLFSRIGILNVMTSCLDYITIITGVLHRMLSGRNKATLRASGNPVNSSTLKMKTSLTPRF